MQSSLSTMFWLFAGVLGFEIINSKFLCVQCLSFNWSLTEDLPKYFTKIWCKLNEFHQLYKLLNKYVKYYQALVQEPNPRGRIGSENKVTHLQILYRLFSTAVLHESQFFNTLVCILCLFYNCTNKVILCIASNKSDF